MKFLPIVCILFILACQPQETSSSLSPEDVTAVMEATAQYGTSIVEGDYQQMRSLMDAQMILMPPQASAKNGIDAAVGFMEGGPGVEGTITPDEVEGSGRLAYVRGTVSLMLIVNDTLQIPFKGKYLELWKKQDDGSWKLAVDIYNSDVSPEM
jgi:ketosteroid isomerase-like protein